MEHGHLHMVYLLKIVIFHGYVSHNQMVSWDSKYPIISELQGWFRASRKALSCHIPSGSLWLNIGMEMAYRIDDFRFWFQMISDDFRWLTYSKWWIFPLCREKNRSPVALSGRQAASTASTLCPSSVPRGSQGGLVGWSQISGFSGFTNSNRIMINISG
jgi:hypothetical protein